MTACPCCLQGETVVRNSLPEPHFACSCCGHRWRVASGTAAYYETKSGRNQVPARHLDRKFADRMATVAPLLEDKCRILEIGCAEGKFGSWVKTRAGVVYAGLEISRDAAIAATRLDRVFTSPASCLPEDRYDLLLSFHVLEHISDIHSEIRHWLRLLQQTGAMLIEVPNTAGHPLREWDTHPEHLHFFSATSLSALLDHAGLCIESLSSGHFESPIYADSLRIVARLKSSSGARTDRLLARFRQLLGGPFVVYGIGGDFRNCVLPVLNQLPVAALVDSDLRRVGEQIGEHVIQAFDPDGYADLPILISSLRFTDEIFQRLRESLPASARLVGLEEIYELN